MVQVDDSLNDWLHPLALQILRDVLKGLLALHAINMVHRDIKSHNVLVERAGDGSFLAKVRSAHHTGGRGGLGPSPKAHSGVGVAAQSFRHVLVERAGVGSFLAKVGGSNAESAQSSSKALSQV